MKIKFPSFKFGMTAQRMVISMAIMLMVVGASFAQSTIDITADDINQIWTGMNIMIGALAGILFLIAGFAIGPKLLGAILRIVEGAFDNLGR